MVLQFTGRWHVVMIIGHHISNKPRIVRDISVGYNNSLPDLLILNQHRLNFTQLNPVTTQLNLLIGTTQILNDPVFPVAGQIARAVQAASANLIEWIRYKTFCSETGLAPVSTSNANSADVNFTFDSNRRWPQHLIENIHSHVPDGPPYGNRT